MPSPTVPGWEAPGPEAPGEWTPRSQAVMGRAARGRRLLAWLVDFALVVTVAVLLGIYTFHRISGMVTDVGLAEQGVWEILGSHGDVQGVATGLGLRLWHSAVRDVEQAFVVLTILTFGYQLTTLLLIRRTLGKALLGLRVVPKESGLPGPLGRKRAVVRAAVTAMADVGCYALACCLLLEGDFYLAWVCWLISAAVFMLNAAPTLLGTGRSLADRFAGTAVTNVLWAEGVAYAADRGRAVWQGGQRAAQRVMDQERVRRVTESEQAQRVADLSRAAARGGRTAWEGTRQGAQEGAQRAADRVRQVADSDLGRAAADKGRAAFSRAAGRFRRTGHGSQPQPQSPPPAFGPPAMQPPAGFPPPAPAPSAGFTPPAPPPPAGFPPSAPPPPTGFTPPAPAPSAGFTPPAPPPPAGFPPSAPPPPPGFTPSDSQGWPPPPGSAPSPTEPPPGQPPEQ